MSKAIQLELPLYDASGKVAQKGCTIATLNFSPSLTEQEKAEVRRSLIPGLDAALCRCDGCKKQAEKGIWWFSPSIRERVIKRVTAFEALNRGRANGELERDAA